MFYVTLTMQVIRFGIACCYLVSEKIFTNVAGWLLSNLFPGDLSREAR
jgi:hypothetical protein